MQRGLLVLIVAVCLAVAPGCERSQAVDDAPAEAGGILGKPAPAFVTVDPQGNPVDLKSYLGKNVILLDFWATWCGPCVMAMPDVSGVAAKFKDQGLVFYAVNASEDPDTVKEFLVQNGFDIPVAMDFDGKIQRSYEANALPSTVLIGKDGRVQVMHRGYWPGLGAELTEQVTALLEGRDLAGAQ